MTVSSDQSPELNSAGIATSVAIGLNAVLAAVERNTPLALCVETADGLALPYGPFDPERHRTFEIGVRDWVEQQTNVSLGYIEQLYTFGDKGREAPAAALDGGVESDRIVSVGYLALASSAAEANAPGAGWRNWYSFFPWEDWREGEPEILAQLITPQLRLWSEGEEGPKRELNRVRINRAFGLEEFGWEEERTLDRYELMYEAGLITEAWRDRKSSDAAPTATGVPMISDHRRILATAIGRVRGKLKYRPVIYEMMQHEFTLLQLQRAVEAIIGFRFHKQNFRRSVEKSAFVRPTGATCHAASGRPAALFQVNRDALKDRAAGGLGIPRLKR